ncbi:MAG: family 16 glycoside hydrolase [Verrucomicrobiaceae bacterium]
MSTEPHSPPSQPQLSSLGRALLGGDTGNPGTKPSPGPWQPPTAEELQALLPQYHVHRLLGRGGMGAVYQGTQRSLNRPVAIKILSAELDDSDMGFAERFKNEAHAMARLNHPGIVNVYDSGEASSGLLYIVMEFVEGTDVQQMINANGRLQTDHAMAIAAHVCDALAYAHERGIIHRDIKPSNIMVGYDGSVKVADFGLAKIATGASTAGLTLSGMAMGTMHYMAPEALIQGITVDHRADVYAVGVMLYQMLTGKLPQGLFEMPSLQVPGLDPRYDGIISQAMREDREKRYQKISEMRHALDAILTRPVVKADADAATPPAASLLPTQARPQRPGGQRPRPPQQKPQPTVIVQKKGSPLLWVALLAISAVAAWLFLDRAKPAGPKVVEVVELTPVEPKVKTSTPVEPEVKSSDWIPLFNGKDLAGWEALPSNLPVSVVNGMMLIRGADDAKHAGHIFYVGNGSLKSSIPQMRNFEAITTVKTTKKGNSGLRIHANPAPAVSAYNINSTGIEIDLWNEGMEDNGSVPKHRTGSALGILQVATSPFKDDEWFTMRTRVEGNRLQVWLQQEGGESWSQIVDWTQPADWAPPANRRYIRLDAGTLAFWNWLPAQGEVWVKEVKVRSLDAFQIPVVAIAPSVPAPDTEGWLSLFNGKDLTGWELQPAEFPADVQNGAIRIRGSTTIPASGNMYYRGPGNAMPQWTDLEVICTVMTGNKGNSGVFLHSTPGVLNRNRADGVEVQMWNDFSQNGSTGKSGSLQRVAPAATARFGDGDWFMVKARVEGKRVQTWLKKPEETEWWPAADWTQPADWVSPRTDGYIRLGSGTISLQNNPPLDGFALFKDIKVRLLNRPAASSTPTTTTTSSLPAKPTDTFNGHRYQFVPGSTSWAEAKAKAESMGGHLATITSKEENELLLATFKSHLSAEATPLKVSMIWLGGIEEQPGSGWKWVTGEPFQFTAWMPGEPNGEKGGRGQIGHPFMLNFYSGGTLSGWNDNSADAVLASKMLGFIVEWDPVATTAPSPSPTALVASPTLWIDAKGRTLSAKFVRLESGNVLLDITGRVTPVALASLSPESQKIARDLQAAMSPSPARSIPGGAVAATDSGWVPLFPNDSLAGWTGDVAGYRVVDGILASTEKGGDLISPKEYGSFHLKFDLRISAETNSGIGIWADIFSPAGWRAGSGFEVQIQDDTASKFSAQSLHQRHGGIYYFRAPDKLVMGPVGSWNTHEIKVEGTQVTVTINDSVVVNTDIAQLRSPVSGGQPLDVRRKSGHLVFMGRAGTAEFRNVMIKELPSAVGTLPAQDGSGGAAISVTHADVAGRLFKFSRYSFSTMQPLANFILSPNGQVNVGGRASGGPGKNESKWEVRDGKLVFKSTTGKDSVVYDGFRRANGKLWFQGRFLLMNPAPNHVLEEL